MEYSLSGRGQDKRGCHLTFHPAREGAPWPRRESATYRMKSENQRGRRNILVKTFAQGRNCWVFVPWPMLMLL